MTPTTTNRPTATLRVELAAYAGRTYRHRLTISAASGPDAGAVLCSGWFGGRAEAETAGRGFCQVNGYDVVKGEG